DGKLYCVRLLDLPPAPANAGNARAAPPRRGRSTAASAAAAGNDVVSPMHGSIVELKTGEGSTVEEGQTVAVVEAMKMMNEIRAHRSGTVVKVHAAAGHSVEAGAPIVTIE
ncbi:MAG TPA: biotin/lipoyl-containing protein, partial [Candidatus Tumulicola sp.]|nr:biotin/lipoyl-containing protein [Candidatus Tumulicola sp.]